MTSKRAKKPDKPDDTSTVFEAKVRLKTPNRNKGLNPFAYLAIAFSVVGIAACCITGLAYVAVAYIHSLPNTAIVIQRKMEEPNPNSGPQTKVPEHKIVQAEPQKAKKKTQTSRFGLRMYWEEPIDLGIILGIRSPLIPRPCTPPFMPQQCETAPGFGDKTPFRPTKPDDPGR